MIIIISTNRGAATFEIPEDASIDQFTEAVKAGGLVAGFNQAELDEYIPPLTDPAEEEEEEEEDCFYKRFQWSPTDGFKGSDH